MSLIILILASLYAYIFSSKSSVRAEDYWQRLKLEENAVERKIALRSSTSPSDLLALLFLQCQLKLCQHESALQSVYLPALMKHNGELACDVSLFAGNIYIELGKYQLAQENYLQSINWSQTNKSLSNSIMSGNSEASSLNNLAVSYYLQAKCSKTKEDAKEKYLHAAQYLDQSKLLLSQEKNSNLLSLIERNKKECLVEFKFLN